MPVNKAGGVASTFNTSSSTLSFSYTVSTSADALIVGVGVGNSANPVQTVSSVTYAGAALTQVVSVTDSDPGGPFVRSELWRRLAPATGANTVTINLSAVTSGLIGGAQGFIGVNQTTPVSNTKSTDGNNTAPTVSVVSATDEWTIACVNAGSSVSGLTQNQEWLIDINNNGAGNCGGSDAVGAASVTHAATVTPADVWAYVALSLKAAPPAAGGSVVSPRLSALLGVGS